MPGKDTEKKILVELSKEDVITLLVGFGPPFGGIEELTKFTGNQWNENWAFDRDKCRKYSIEDLWKLFVTLKEEANI